MTLTTNGGTAVWRPTPEEELAAFVEHHEAETSDWVAENRRLRALGWFGFAGWGATLFALIVVLVR